MSRRITPTRSITTGRLWGIATSSVAGGWTCSPPSGTPIRTSKTNIRIEIDGDTAHSETYCLFCQRRRDGERVLEFGGARYIDRLERRDGEWRIAARRTVMDWTAYAQTQDFGGTEDYPRGRWDREDASYERPLVLPEPGR